MFGSLAGASLMQPRMRIFTKDLSAEQKKALPAWTDPDPTSCMESIDLQAPSFQEFSKVISEFDNSSRKGVTARELVKTTGVFVPMDSELIEAGPVPLALQADAQEQSKVFWRGLLVGLAAGSSLALLAIHRAGMMSW